MENAEVILAATRKKPQCPYRLVNIRSSEGLAQHGNGADRADLDAGKIVNNQLFWEGVQESFKSQDEIYDNLNFADDEVLSDFHHINFW